MVLQGRVVALAHDDDGVVGEHRRAKFLRVGNDVDGEAFFLQRRDTFFGDIAGVVLVVAK